MNTTTFSETQVARMIKKKYQWRFKGSSCLCLMKPEEFPKPKNIFEQIRCDIYCGFDWCQCNDYSNLIGGRWLRRCGEL